MMKYNNTINSVKRKSNSQRWLNGVKIVDKIENR